MKSDPTDELATRWSLVERLKHLSDQDSWQEFFNTYWRLIHGVAGRSGLSPVEAEEVVQAVVLGVCRNIQTFEANPAAGSFRSWLLQLTYWRIKDEIRKRPPAAPAERAGEDPAQTSLAERIPDADQFSRFWDQEWEDLVRKTALERLQARTKAQDYQVFLQYVIKETAAEEVARKTGVTTARVYVVKNQLTPHYEAALRHACKELERRR